VAFRIEDGMLLSSCLDAVDVAVLVADEIVSAAGTGSTNRRSERIGQRLLCQDLPHDDAVQPTEGWVARTEIVDIHGNAVLVLAGATDDAAEGEEQLLWALGRLDAQYRNIRLVQLRHVISLPDECLTAAGFIDHGEGRATCEVLRHLQVAERVQIQQAV